MADQETNTQTAEAVQESSTRAQDVAGQDGAQANDEVVKLRQERDELFERLARLSAEFDNYRKRSQRENEEYRQYAVAEAVKAFLPILDNFNLALRHENSTAEDLRKGVELIGKQMEDALTRLGVHPVHTQGAPFDPHHHEAIEMVESDEHPENHVVEELQRGYKLRDRLLRPAMVRVAKKK
jgi:molecular chaperone GrpE